MATYSIDYTDAFLVESLERYRSLPRRSIARLLIKSVCFIGLAALMLLLLFADAYLFSALFASFIALLLAGPRFDYWLMRRRFKKSPFYGQRLELRVEEQGFCAQSEISKLELSWRAFAKWFRVKDGFLVTRQNEVHWWPDSALVEGDVDQVRGLLERSITSAH